MWTNLSAIVRQHNPANRFFRSLAGSALVLGLVAGYLWFFALTMHGRGDEGLLLCPAERVLNGQIPYRDFFTELAPGTFYIQAALFKVFGVHLLSARLPLLLLMSVIGWQIFWLARRILPAFIAVLPVLIYCVTAFTRWLIVSHHWYSLFFALTAAIFLVRYVEEHNSSRLFWAGVSVSACALCMQSKGAFVLLATYLILFLDYRSSRRRNREPSLAGFGWFTAGVLTLASVPILYFYRQNALDHVTYSTFTYLWQSYLGYEYQPLIFLPDNFWRLLSGLTKDFSLLQFGKVFSNLLWSILIPLGAIFCVVQYRRKKGENPEHELRGRVLMLYLLLGLALMFSEAHRFDFIHSLFAAPVLLILAVTLVHDRAFLNTRRAKAAEMLLVSLAVFYVAHGASLAWREQKRHTAVQCRRGIFYQTPERAARFQSIVDTIESRIQPGGPIFLYPYSSILYFLTATTNPTRLDALLPGQTTPAHFDEVLSLLRSKKAPSFVLSFWREKKALLPELFPNVRPEILEDHPVERFLQGPTSPFKPILVQDRWILYQKDQSDKHAHRPEPPALETK